MGGSCAFNPVSHSVSHLHFPLSPIRERATRKREEYIYITQAHLLIDDRMLPRQPTEEHSRPRAAVVAGSLGGAGVYLRVSGVQPE